MAKFLFASVVPVCTLSTYPEGKKRTLHHQVFAFVPWHTKKGQMDTKQ